MKTLFMLFLLCLMSLLAHQPLSAQTVTLKIYATDGVGQDSVVIGTAPTATNGIDTALGEKEIPPPPPTFDFRCATRVPDDNLGAGTHKNLHHLNNDAQTDKYKLQFQSDENGDSVTFTWQAGLGGVGGGYWHLTGVNPNTSVAFDIDMASVTSFTFPAMDVLPQTVTIIKGDGKAYRTMTAFALSNQVDAKGKHKAVGRVKKGAKTSPNSWKTPNYLNLVDEVFDQGAFPGLLATGKPAGLVVGVQGQTGLDSHGKPIFKFIYHPPKIGKPPKPGSSSAVIIKSIVGKINVRHNAPAHCLDVDSKLKNIAKALNTASPDKYNNELIAELITLKLNIAINTVPKIIGPLGPATNFGGLHYKADVTDPSGYDGKTVAEIAAQADSALSCYLTSMKGGTIAQLVAVLQRINGAFAVDSVGNDTLSFNASAGTGKLLVKAAKALAQQSILYRTSLVEAPSATYPDMVFSAPEPTQYELMQNYPNPFNPTTTIEFNLAEDARVTLKIYNTLGQEVATLVDHEDFTEGNNTVEFDASHLSTGVYYYKIIVNDGQFQQAKKMLLVK